MLSIKKNERINKHLILSILFSFFVFLSINLPSVKLLYSSVLLNVIALSGLLVVGTFRWAISNKKYTIDYRLLRFSLFFLSFWLILFTVTWFKRPLNFNITELFQYISVIVFTLSLLLFLNKADLKYMAGFQIVWGTSIATAEWLVGIPKVFKLGQNYLTSGVVIAATIMIVFGVVFSKKTPLFAKLLMVIPFPLLFLGLTSLSGRAPILLSIFVPSVVFLLTIFFEKNLRKKLVILVGFIILLVIAFNILINSLSQYTIDRILRIFLTIQEEPRFDVYLSSIEVIFNNPLGIGLNGYQNYDFGYPHNIFLEIVMSGGWLAILPFVAILKEIFVVAYKTLSEKNNTIIWLNLCLYLFLTFNISFNLTSSYMVFIAIIIFIKADSLLNTESQTIQTDKVIIQKINFFKEKSFTLINNDE